MVFKRKVEGEEKLVGRKEVKIMEFDSSLMIMFLFYIFLKNIMDVEGKLVYVDEEDVSYEFVEIFVFIGIRLTC